MPWARSSLGTIEFLDDLWQQDVAASSLETISSAGRVIDAVRQHGTAKERAYLDSCARSMSGGATKGLRFIPRTGICEMNEILKTEDAMGHQMMTAGLSPQYYWCDLCSAYTGYRARKLTKQ